MNFEELQKTWQSSSPAATITIDSNLLLKEVRRNQKQFWRTIFWRDTREVGVAILLVIFFIPIGIWGHDWTYDMLGLVCLGVGTFMVVDRFIQRRKRPTANDPLKGCIVRSLHEVNHQVWLLKNVGWWYLLPLTGGLVIADTVDLWRSNHGWSAWVNFLIMQLVNVLIWLGIYWLNQRAVRKSLIPRREELEGLLSSLDSDSPQPKTHNSMRYQILFSILVVSAMAIAITFASTGPSKLATEPPSTRSSGPPSSSDDQVQAMEKIRKKYDLPALAVVVVKDGVICDNVAVGVRKLGDPTLVTTNDVFHIGSCTKSMTATLAGMLIDDGKLRWDTTIADVFPELKGKMNKEYESVTVEQLLTHRGGIPEDPPTVAWLEAFEAKGTPVEQRSNFIKAVLNQTPAATPGTKMIYSNQGYAIVGAMLERITGTPWETLITERLFKPLHMDTAGFGPPGTPGKVDEPWGHRRMWFVTKPYQLDNPPAISPAGRVHCSLDDFARYAIFQLEDKPALLKPDTFAKLHTAPAGSDYACGWVVSQRTWAGGKTLWHNGSNTFFYFAVWLAPNKKFAVITATNSGKDNTFDACDDADVYMIDHWLGPVE